MKERKGEKTRGKKKNKGRKGEKEETGIYWTPAVIQTVLDTFIKLSLAHLILATILWPWLYF